MAPLNEEGPSHLSIAERLGRGSIDSRIAEPADPEEPVHRLSDCAAAALLAL
jgi:hypothetical protein